MTKKQAKTPWFR